MLKPIKEIPLVPVKDIERGDHFVKRGGEYAHIRLSESSVKFHGLNPNKVYGVTYNGNISALDPDKLVHPVTAEYMAANREGENNWNRTFAKPPFRLLK